MNRKESSWSRFCQIGEGEIRLFLESWSPPLSKSMVLSSPFHQIPIKYPSSKQPTALCLPSHSAFATSLPWQYLPLG